MADDTLDDRFKDRGILGNLGNDLLHVFDRGTLQQQRSMRNQYAQSKADMAIQQQAAQAAIQKQLDNAAIAKWQDAYGDAPVPMDENGKVRRSTINGMISADGGYADTHAVNQDTRTQLATGKTSRRIQLANDANTYLGDTSDDLEYKDTAITPPKPPAAPAPAQPSQMPMASDDSAVPDQAPMPIAPAPSAPIGQQTGPFNPAANNAPTMAQRILQAKTATELAKARQDDQNRTDILGNERRALVNAKQVDDFGAEFGRGPQGKELNPDGTLSSIGLNAVYEAKQKKATGFQTDPNKPGAWMPIPGGPADIKQQAAQAALASQKDAEAAKIQQFNDTRTNLQDNIAQAIPQVGFTTSGNVAGSVARYIPVLGQNAENLHANLEAIKSGLGVDTLNAMRASSKSGNTGIGRVMQIEFDAFAKAARNLDQTQDPAQLKQHLQDLQTHLTKWHAAKDQLDAQQGSTATPQSNSPAPAPRSGAPVKIGKYDVTFH